MLPTPSPPTAVIPAFAGTTPCLWMRRPRSLRPLPLEGEGQGGGAAVVTRPERVGRAEPPPLIPPPRGGGRRLQIRHQTRPSTPSTRRKPGSSFLIRIPKLDPGFRRGDAESVAASSPNPKTAPAVCVPSPSRGRVRVGVPRLSRGRSVWGYASATTEPKPTHRAAHGPDPWATRLPTAPRSWHPTRGSSPRAAR
ncbi:hypothetical protein SAMN02745223_03857 [Devosia limi DSM 17137]|uniref:Uncharacterized protein n=1 Tax=Devosia limi DSM 17137 TaxID=1121477 RepID=A0A1M5FHH8_9HYPH|nr:hypothetical protein SAMN02745223_03857 [Devosia limi DSM 17137]